MRQLIWMAYTPSCTYRGDAHATSQRLQWAHQQRYGPQVLMSCRQGEQRLPDNASDTKPHPSPQAVTATGWAAATGIRLKADTPRHVKHQLVVLGADSIAAHTHTHKWHVTGRVEHRVTQHALH
jgi:hypothetical protein